VVCLNVQITVADNSRHPPVRQLTIVSPCVLQRQFSRPIRTKSLLVLPVTNPSRTIPSPHPRITPQPYILSKRSLHQEKSNRPLPLFFCHGWYPPWTEVCAFFNANKTFKLIVTVWVIVICRNNNAQTKIPAIALSFVDFCFFGFFFFTVSNMKFFVGF